MWVSYVRRLLLVGRLCRLRHLMEEVPWRRMRRMGRERGTRRDRDQYRGWGQYRVRE